jgi:hypothetical protein
MYAAWWLFLIALTVSGGVGMAGSGVDDLNRRPSHGEWTARRWTLLGIVVSALCVVGGFVAFCEYRGKLRVLVQVAKGIFF